MFHQQSIQVDIFELLNIEPTNDYNLVKKAFRIQARQRHPDKAPKDTSQEELNFITEQYQQFNADWELVDDEEKFTEYFNNYERGHSTGFSNRFSGEEFNFKEGTETTNIYSPYFNHNNESMFVPRKGYTKIFIPVGVWIQEPDKINEEIQPSIGFIPRYFPHDENSELNFQSHLKLQAIMNYFLTDFGKNAQIGVNFDEALKVLNQHSHRTAFVIAEVYADLNNISVDKVSEKKLYGPHVLNASSNEFFILLDGSKILPEDVIAIHGLKSGVDSKSHYKNTPRYSEIKKPHWPEGFVYYPNNLIPCNSHLEEIENVKSDNDELIELSENLKKIKYTFWDSKDSENMRNTILKIINEAINNNQPIDSIRNILKFYIDEIRLTNSRSRLLEPLEKFIECAKTPSISNITNNKQKMFTIQQQHPMRNNHLELRVLLTLTYNELPDKVQEALSKQSVYESAHDAQNNWDEMSPFSRVQILYRIDSLGLLDDEANEKYDLNLEELWVESDSQERKSILKDFAKELMNSNAIIKRL